MTNLHAGTIQTVRVLQRDGSRWLLDLDGIDLYMNASEAPEELTEGDSVEVFLFMNRRGELAASMQLPKTTMGTYGWARVLRVDDKEGAYVDIGASFEVLVNKADLPRVRKLWPKIDDELYMTLRTDPAGTLFGRLATEERVLEVIGTAEKWRMNDNLTARPYRLLPVGSFLLSIPDNYRIFVHESEMAAEPRLGEELAVRIIDVQEDGTLNGSLLPRKQERLDDDAEMILGYLQETGGKMPFTDKSNPDEISEMFNLSKGAFKRALGRLMKESKIEQRDGWTFLKD
ncbi:CvfB family protein [Sporosarcina aquimarina]|uniref:S1-like domain-containing RNA-binding protein n=1 Tax=Sporosarcina aquimarina TaxID=114975 RepID=A0ABU4FZI1_9BACL|nr:S1-like domain-containing RNA-binding protein [Sporosarcina aquimarina]MDW0110139.1 S1-like domain-containing RNA-binding protein [Sporosarcina aquimarina]